MKMAYLIFTQRIAPIDEIFFAFEQVRFVDHFLNHIFVGF